MIEVSRELSYAEKFRIAAVPSHYRILTFLASRDDAMTVRDIHNAFPEMAAQSIQQWMHRLCKADILATSKTSERGGYSCYYVSNDDFAQRLFASGLLSLE